MRITRLFVLLALAALVAPQVEASRTSVWESTPPASIAAPRADAAGLLTALAPAARLDASPLASVEAAEPPLFDLGDIILADAADTDAGRFELGPLTLVDPNLLRGPPPSYPETRVGGFELLPPFRVGASPSLSLWSRQACGFSCWEVVSDSRYDPWGLITTFTANVGPGDVLPTANLETGITAVDVVLGMGNNLFNLGAKFVNAGANFVAGTAVVQDKVDESAWENGIACRGCTSFGLDMAGVLSGTREAQAAYEVLGVYGRGLAGGARDSLRKATSFEDVVSPAVEKGLQEGASEGVAALTPSTPLAMGKGGGKVSLEGQFGESVTSGLYGKKNTEVFTINGRDRIPDHVLAQDAGTRSPTVLVETKNVKYQHLSEQLKDDLSLVGPGGKVILEVPANGKVASTVSRNPRIEVRRNLPPKKRRR